MKRKRKNGKIEPPFRIYILEPSLSKKSPVVFLKILLTITIFPLSALKERKPQTGNHRQILLLPPCFKNPISPQKIHFGPKPPKEIKGAGF
jgi:hypothetical protein